MRTRLIVTTLLIGLLSAGFLPSPASAQSTPTPPTSSLIVKVVTGLTADAQAAIVGRNGGTLTSAIPALRLLVVSVASEDLAAALARYQADPQVQSVEENKVRVSESVPSDLLYVNQWALPKIGWDQVFGIVTPTGSAKVAVLDTGVDATHPELADKVLPGTSILDGSDGMTDPSGHGTWLAGIIAAQTNTIPADGIAGVAYAGVKILPVTVLNANGEGQDSDVIAGVIWAVDHGADVILMAFSNPGFSQNLQDAIDYAWSKNVVVVAAVGNNASSEPTFPAGDRGVMGVAATDPSDTLAWFSNAGQAVFIAAPGVDIQTIDIGDAYTVISGTSTAAAIVTASAALMKAVDPTLTNGVIVGRLARNADPAGLQSETGNGRVNLPRALADTSVEFVQPAGAAPVGSGGPFIGPYLAAHTPVPTNLTATALSPTSVMLAWQGPESTGGANAGHTYEILRCSVAGCTPSVVVAGGLTPNAPNTFTNTALTPNTLYRYTVRYRHSPTEVSAPSNIAQVTTPPLDTTAPTVTINQSAGQADPTDVSPINFTTVFSEPVTGFTDADVTITGTAGGSKTVLVTGGPTTFNVAVSGMTTSGTVIANIAAGVATDAAGNPNVASTSSDNTVTWDVTAPTVTINQAAAQADPTNVSPINFTVIFSEPVTGFTSTDVAITGTAGGTKTIVVSGGGTTFNVAVSGMTDGTVIASIAAGAAADAAGNTSEAATSTDSSVTYDATSPMGTVAINGGAEFTKTLSVSLNLTCSDAVSGCSKVAFSNDGTIFSAFESFTAIKNHSLAAGSDGVRTVHVKFQDAAGNISDAFSDTIILDTEAPNVTVNPAAHICSLPGNAGWCRGTQTAGFTATDATSGLAALNGCAGGATSCNFTRQSTDNGVAVMIPSGEVCDRAGNCAASLNAGPFMIDSVGPQLARNTAADSCSTPGDGGWCRGTQTAGFRASDSTSGLQALNGCLAGTNTCEFTRSTTTNGAAIQIPSGQACDVAGNCTPSIDAGPFKIDSVAPQVVRDPAADSCSMPGNAGWCRGTQTAGFAASDGTSGLMTLNGCAAGATSCGFTRQTSTNGAAIHVPSGPVCDLAGNCSLSINAGPYMIDSAPPDITLTSPQDGSIHLLNQAVASSYGCADATSGVASCVGPVASGSNFDTLSVGAKSFTVNSNDVAGNTATRTHNYAVQYASGLCLGSPGHAILQPINVDGTSVFKQKSTVPAKFRVCDALGNSIGTPGVVASFRLIQKFSGTVTETLDYFVDSTTPDSAFRWDPIDRQWIFNISTKSLQSGYTYVYRIDLDDGTSITFQFGLK